MKLVDSMRANQAQVSGSGDKVLQIFFMFPASVVQSYFLCSIQFL